MAVPWTKAKVFFFTDGDICFLVENVMFKIHREQIKLQKSDYFKKFLEKPKKDTDRPEDKPFHIQGHGKTPESFTHLCDVLYKLKIDPESPKRRAPAFHPKDPKLLLTLAKSTWIYECLVSHSLIQNTLPDWAPTFKELFTETPLEVLIDWVVVMDQKNPHSTPQEKEEHTKYRNKVMNTFYFRMLKEEHKDHNDPTSEHVGTIMKIGPGPGEECFAALLYCYLAYHSADQVETILSSKDNPVGACLDEWTVWSSGILFCRTWLCKQWRDALDHAQNLENSGYCDLQHGNCRKILRQKLEKWNNSQLSEDKKKRDEGGNGMFDIMGHYYGMLCIADGLRCSVCFANFAEAMDPLVTAVGYELKRILVNHCAASPISWPEPHKSGLP